MTWLKNSYAAFARRYGYMAERSGHLSNIIITAWKSLGILDPLLKHITRSDGGFMTGSMLCRYLQEWQEDLLNFRRAGYTLTGKMMETANRSTTLMRSAKKVRDELFAEKPEVEPDWRKSWLVAQD